jgi:hypothetical protein
MKKEKVTTIRLKETRGRKKGTQMLHLRVIKDETLYPYYKLFVQHRNQAQYRNEDYLLNFYEWIDAYGEHINNRGKRVGQVMLKRIDKNLPWRPNNIQLIKIEGKNYTPNVIVPRVKISEVGLPKIIDLRKK